ncbi:hypothetical protein KC644_03570 [Candidatus Berkelbacteria bacterium]|nr:hypothetical protein [Candidatus Berkelbacteria bacterium]
MSLDRLKTELAIKLRSARAFKIRSESEDGKGFKLKKHRDNPELDLPLSPYYLNLRTSDNPKPGPLDETLVDLVAKVFAQKAKDCQLKFSHVCGIPNAATPYARQLARLSKKSTVQLKKIGDGFGDFAANWSPRESSALVIDDVITTGASKIPALKILTNAGFKIPAIVVLVDRQEGGREILKNAGYRVEAIYTTTEITEILAYLGGITKAEKKDILSYVQNS